MRVHKVDPSQRLRILLTNGRFPVALDLARQLRKVGHMVYIVDPMHFHITKFSKSVKKSFQVPAPHDSAAGYIDCIRRAVATLRIQLILPMHEEIFYLAQVEDLMPYMFVSPFHKLIALHNKWSFYQLVTYAGLQSPPTLLCKSMDDIRKLDLSKEYALKPVFGRAKSGIHHLKPGEQIPELTISEDIPYIAQEWYNGTQLCSYAVARNGEIKAAAVYPVIDTIDGSSCVFFKSIDHPGIKHFMEVMAHTYNLTGQLAFDFIEMNGQLYTLECNPRATSGIHLFNKTPWLANAMTNPAAQRMDAQIGKKMQMVPGMLMWEPRENTRHEKVQHTRRLFGTHDILFRMSDPFPAFLQPFLYVTYKRQCSKKKLELKELFQWDVIWEPRTDEIRRAKEEMSTANDNVTMAITNVSSANSHETTNYIAMTSSTFGNEPQVLANHHVNLQQPVTYYDETYMPSQSTNFSNYGETSILPESTIYSNYSETYLPPQPTISSNETISSDPILASHPITSQPITSQPITSQPITSQPILNRRLHGTKSIFSPHPTRVSQPVTAQPIFSPHPTRVSQPPSN